MHASGSDDCVLLIGFGSDGDVSWVRRETADLRMRAPAELDDTVVVLRIDINAATRRVTDTLHQRMRDTET